MVEQRLSVRDEHLRKGNSEEADTIVARYSPKLRSLWGRQGTSGDVIVTQTVNLAALL